MPLDQLIRHIEARTKRAWGRPSWWNLLAVLPWVLLVAFELYGYRADQIVAAREQTTPGQIVSHEPSNHDRFRYQFSIDGKQFTGWAIPSATEYEIGQQVIVYYDPLDPNKSALADFADSGTRIVGPVSFCVFGVGAVILLIFIRRRATRRA